MAILVDTSSNVIGIANFATVMKFVKKVFHSFSLGIDGLRYGLVVFGDTANVCGKYNQNGCNKNIALLIVISSIR